MELRKRNRGSKLKEIRDRITPQQHARTYKQMAIATRIADALEAKGWSKSEFASRMGQLPSVVTRWLSGTQNFTIDTLSDIEEMLGVQLLVTDVRYAADHPKNGQSIVPEGFKQRQFAAPGELIIEHHYVPVFYKADPVPAGCDWMDTPRSVQFTKVVCATPSLN